MLVRFALGLTCRTRIIYSSWQVKKQIKILDHRLEKALAKHNHTLASNKRLREGIDNMRRERIVFAQVRFVRRACHRWRCSVAGWLAATWRELGCGLPTKAAGPP